MNDKEEENKTEGKEIEGSSSKKEAPANDNPQDRVPADKEESPSIVKEAILAAADLKTENNRREKILEEEKKVLDRKETLNALGGGSPAGTESKPNLTAEEIASEEKIKAVGNATGAQWAKDMDKKDG